MPSGKTHDLITAVAAAAVIPAWWFVAPVWGVAPPPSADGSEAITLGVSTLVSGLLFSPDLDLNSSIYRRWGPLRFLWWPYQKLLPHRSDFSHGFVLGPLVRLLYFGLVAWGLLRILTWAASLFVSFDRNGLSQRTTDLVVNAYQTYPRHFALFLAGMFLGAGLHTGADLLVSAFKRRHGRQRR